MSLPTRKIGAANVTALGFGAMGIAAYYATTIGEEERFKVSTISSVLFSVMNHNHLSLSTALGRGIRERMHQLGYRRRVRG